MNLFINTQGLSFHYSLVHFDSFSFLLHHLHLRAQIHAEEEFVVVVFVQRHVNLHERVVLQRPTALTGGSHRTKRGHAPFNMARREAHRRLNVGMAALYMQNTEAQIMLQFCGNVNITLFKLVGKWEIASIYLDS